MPHSPLSAAIRLDYIDAVMVNRGKISPDDIVDAWGVSMSQASMDLSEFQRQHSRVLVHDKSGKRYVARKAPYVSVRGQKPGDFVVRIPIAPLDDAAE